MGARAPLQVTHAGPGHAPTMSQTHDCDPLAPTRLDLGNVTEPTSQPPVRSVRTDTRRALTERRAALHLLAALVCERPSLVPRVLGDVFAGDVERMRTELGDPAAVEVMERYLSAEPCDTRR